MAREAVVAQQCRKSVVSMRARRAVVSRAAPPPVHRIRNVMLAQGPSVVSRLVSASQESRPVRPARARENVAADSALMVSVVAQRARVIATPAIKRIRAASHLERARRWPAG